MSPNIIDTDARLSRAPQLMGLSVANIIPYEICGEAIPIECTQPQCIRVEVEFRRDPHERLLLALS